MRMSRTNIFGLVASILAVGGVVLNNNRIIECFWLWIASNIICSVIHVRAGLWTMAGRDVIFIILAIDGLIRWSNG